MDKKFIVVKDLATAEKLSKANYVKVYNSNDCWMFVNRSDAPITFESNKVSYTDKLLF